MNSHEFIQSPMSFPVLYMLEIFHVLYYLSCLIMSRDVQNDDEEVDTEHEKRKRRVN